MKTTVVVTVLCSLLGAGFDVQAGERFSAVSVDVAPELDGVVDPVWERAAEFTVSVSPVTADVGGLYPGFDRSRRTAAREVTLRALVSDGRLYLLARWPDETRSVVKKPWVWDEETGAYRQGPGDEDRFSLLLPIGKEMTDCMVSGVSFVGDLWHWKAARTQPAGYADDQSLRMGIKNFRGAEEWFGPGGRTVYGKRYNDSGRSAYTEKKEPPLEFAGGTVTRYEPRQPDASRGDVRAGAEWNEGVWTLELSRALDTGDSRADRVMVSGESIEISVAVFDDCGDLYHATSPMFTLELE
jgi:hypothetical protein